MGSDDVTVTGMGVSSEREVDGEATGTRDTSLGTDRPDPDSEPPEQRPGNPETNPEGIPPKASYSAADPRADDEV